MQYNDENVGAPVTVLIGVEVGSLTREDGAVAAAKGLELLKEYEVTATAEIAMRECVMWGSASISQRKCRHRESESDGIDDINIALRIQLRLYCCYTSIVSSCSVVGRTGLAHRGGLAPRFAQLTLLVQLGVIGHLAR